MGAQNGAGVISIEDMAEENFEDEVKNQTTGRESYLN